MVSYGWRRKQRRLFPVVADIRGLKWATEADKKAMECHAIFVRFVDFAGRLKVLLHIMLVRDAASVQKRHRAFTLIEALVVRARKPSRPGMALWSWSD